MTKSKKPSEPMVKLYHGRKWMKASTARWVLKKSAEENRNFWIFMLILVVLGMIFGK